MSKKAIPTSDLGRIDRMADQDIDYSDIPPLTDEQLAAMRPLREVLPQVLGAQPPVLVQVDAEVVRWFQGRGHKAGGGDYQHLINVALREHIQHEQESLESTLRRVIREEVHPYLTGSAKEPGAAINDVGDPAG